MASIFRRSRDVMVRLLRQPRTAAELFADTHERMAAAEHRTDERLRSVHEELAAGLAAVVDELRASEARTRAAEHRSAVTVAALIAHLASEDAGEVPEPAPHVSIVLPVRDRPGPLRRAVASVLTQTYAAWELVIVDDGSAVPVATTLADLIEGDPR